MAVTMKWKKVKIGHSLLPFHITDYYKAEQIQETAISISSSSTTTSLSDNFILLVHGVNSHKNLKLIAGKPAESILKLLLQLEKNIAKFKKV